MELGRRALLEGNLTRALGSYSAALDLWPDSPYVKLCLAECLRRVGDLKAWRRTLDECIRAACSHAAWSQPIYDAHAAAYPHLHRHAPSPSLIRQRRLHSSPSWD